MKIATPERHLDTNIGSSSAFQIEMNAKAFQVLSSNIYSDKPVAIVREISCNALDANPNRKFIIAAPSSTNPHLLIRDYGPGLNDEDVRVLYTTFFRSTKARDNDAIGGFGLGSKAPLSYSDMFTVRSIQDGVSRSYIIFKNAQGIPEITPGDPKATDEEPGLEVLVPVKQADFQTFKNAIAKVLKHFPPDSYTVHGVAVERKQYATDRGGWAVYAKNPATYNQPETCVLMGPVAYKVNWSTVFGQEVSYNAKYPANGLEMRFNIGELDIMPSREELSHDAQTIQRLKDRHAEIMKQIADDITLREAAVSTRWALAAVQEQIKKELESVWHMSPFANDYNYGRHMLKADSGKSFIHYTDSDFQRVTTPKGEEWTDRQLSEGKYKLIWNDVTDRFPRTVARLRQRRFNMGNYFVFDAKKWVSRADCAKDFGDVPDELWVNLSELPLPPSVGKAAPSGETVVFKFSPNNYAGTTWETKRWADISNTTKDVLYLPLNGPGKVELEGWDKLVTIPWIKGEFDIYGLTKKIRTECELPENFIPVADWVKDKLEATLRDYPETIRCIAAWKELNNTQLLYSDLVHLNQLLDKAPFKDCDDGAFVDYRAVHEKLFDFDPAKVGDALAIRSLKHFHGDALEEMLPAVPKLHEAAEKLLKRRPLLKMALPLLRGMKEDQHDLFLEVLNTTDRWSQ